MTMNDTPVTTDDFDLDIRITVASEQNNDINFTGGTYSDPEACCTGEASTCYTCGSCYTCQPGAC